MNPASVNTFVKPSPSLTVSANSFARKETKTADKGWAGVNMTSGDAAEMMDGESWGAQEPGGIRHFLNLD